MPAVDAGFSWQDCDRRIPVKLDQIVLKVVYRAALRLLLVSPDMSPTPKTRGLDELAVSGSFRANGLNAHKNGRKNRGPGLFIRVWSRRETPLARVP